MSRCKKRSYLPPGKCPLSSVLTCRHRNLISLCEKNSSLEFFLSVVGSKDVIFPLTGPPGNCPLVALADLSFTGTCEPPLRKVSESPAVGHSQAGHSVRRSEGKLPQGLASAVASWCWRGEMPTRCGESTRFTRYLRIRRSSGRTFGVSPSPSPERWVWATRWGLFCI